MSGMAPDKGAGVVPIVYMTFPPFVGGVHSMVTLACSIPYTMLLTTTSRGGPGYVIISRAYRPCCSPSHHEVGLDM